MTTQKTRELQGLRLRGRHSVFDRFASHVTRYAGSPAAFVLAVVIVVAWACTGPLFGFSDTWQIVINTGTTIVTFLMVFLIQQSQNKDSEALHLKLNELLASHRAASNRLVAVEELDQRDLDTLKAFYCQLAELARRDGDISETHSLLDAKAVHGAQRADAP
jgi:low affinity Fe/Cu permease